MSLIDKSVYLCCNWNLLLTSENSILLLSPRQFPDKKIRSIGRLNSCCSSMVGASIPAPIRLFPVGSLTFKSSKLHQLICRLMEIVAATIRSRVATLPHHCSVAKPETLMMLARFPLSHIPTDWLPVFRWSYPILPPSSVRTLWDALRFFWRPIGWFSQLGSFPSRDVQHCRNLLSALCHPHRIDKWNLLQFPLFFDVFRIIQSV